MAGNPVLGFLSVQPTGDGPHATVTKMLRLLGIVVLVGFVVSLVSNVLFMTMGTAYYGGPGGVALGSLGIVSIVIGLVITGLVLFWITFAITAWNAGDPRGNTHVLVIAIIATVLGALGALGLLGALAATAYPVYMVMGVLSGLIAVAELYCGIMILMNRSKATTGTGRTMGATN
jgi:hypothetical protein